jgi:hypothetical protein
MKESKLIGKTLGLVLVFGLLLTGCPQPTDDASFIPVKEITDVPDMAELGTPLPLSGTVIPEDATNQTVVWSVKTQGTTGATLSDGNKLNSTAAGTVTVTATITNGKAEGTAFIQDFLITVSDKVVRPRANPPAGPVASGTTVTLTTSTSGAAIYYATDGSDPTATSTRYTSPITITAAITIKAIAVKVDMTNSDVLTAAYTISSGGDTKAATPRADPPAGLVASGTTVTLTTSTSGAAIYYATDGSEPTATSTRYASPITITAAITIKAIAVKADMTNSDVLTAAYTITEPAPIPANKSALISAITAAQTNISSVTVSINGAEVDFADRWVTQAAKDAYQATITAAQGVSSNESATQAQVDSAVADLTAATTTFNSANQYGLGPNTWTVASGIPAGATINKVAYGNGIFVAVGRNGSNAAYAAWSTEGENWFEAADYTAFGTENMHVSFQNDLFIAYGGSRGNNHWATSGDGRSWTTIGDPATNFNAKGGVSANGYYLIGGSGGRIAYSNGDMSTWTILERETTTFIGSDSLTFINALAFGNGRIVAGGGNGHTAWATDPAGIWTPTSITETIFDNGFINAMIFAEGRFVAVGGRDSGTGKAAYSTDGVNWTQTGAIQIGNGVMVTSIGYGNGVFVLADTRGNASYSTNGITWTLIANNRFSSDTTAIEAVCYGNGRFVIAGGGGRIAYSTRR